jgi:hypothetical protein
MEIDKPNALVRGRQKSGTIYKTGEGVLNTGKKVETYLENQIPEGVTVKILLEGRNLEGDSNLDEELKSSRTVLIV